MRADVFLVVASLPQKVFFGRVKQQLQKTGCSHRLHRDRRNIKLQNFYIENVWCAGGKDKKLLVKIVKFKLLFFLTLNLMFRNLHIFAVQHGEYIL